MDPRQLERYSRHLLLPEIDLDGQERLLRSSAWIVGAGGLGSPAALYLAASGVGRIILSDHDTVDLGNLQRQILHGTRDIDRPKVESAADRLRDVNPDVHVVPLAARLDARTLDRNLKDADVVLDCTDNFPSRFALNTACSRGGVPLVWGAAIRFQGQATVFDLSRADSPCLACLYPDQVEAETAEGCAAAGIFAPAAGLVGCILAAEALKVLLGIGDTLCGRLLSIDLATMTWHEALVSRDPACTVCGAARAGLADAGGPAFGL